MNMQICSRSSVCWRIRRLMHFFYRFERILCLTTTISTLQIPLYTSATFASVEITITVSWNDVRVWAPQFDYRGHRRSHEMHGHRASLTRARRLSTMEPEFYVFPVWHYLSHRIWYSYSHPITSVGSINVRTEFADCEYEQWQLCIRDHLIILKSRCNRSVYEISSHIFGGNTIGLRVSRCSRSLLNLKSHQKWAQLCR